MIACCYQVVKGGVIFCMDTKQPCRECDPPGEAPGDGSEWWYL